MSTLSEPATSAAPPLARVLLRKLLLAYVVFSIALTGAQLFKAYRSLRSDVTSTLYALAGTFAPGAEAAIWEFQGSLLQTMVKGMGQHPMVVRASIHDRKGELHAEWLASDSEASPALTIRYTLTHLRDGQKTEIGELVLASSEDYIWSSLRSTLFSTVFSSLLSVLFLLGMLWILLRHLVVNPLSRFSGLVGKLAESGQEQAIDLGGVDIAEIRTLQQGFNQLMLRLADNRAHIAEQNADLEQRVLARTRDLESSEARFRSIFERANAGILFTDAAGNILQFNSAFAQMLGYSYEQLAGKSILSITHPDDLDDQAAFTDAIKKGLRNDYRRQKRYLTPFQQTIWVDLAVTALRDDGGKVTNFVGLMTDITDRKHAEEALQLAMQAAESANRAKSDFLANMSHEIRTPMNAILGLTQLVLDTELQPTQRDFLKKTHASAQALLVVLNDILDYSKIEAGHMEVERIPLRVEALLRASADLFGGMLAEKDLELFLEIDPAVPAELLGDPLRLTQVINNLLGNAIKFTERGEIHIKVDVAAFAETGLTLRFAVRDTGIGIASEHIGQLFAAFAQADGSITRKYGGTGLGLAICHKLVKLMGGEISAASSAGQGTVFSFTAQVGMPDELPAAPDMRALKGDSVLVVDDHETSRQILQTLLTAWGLAVDTADSGEEGLRRLLAAEAQGRAYSMTLLDGDMHGLSGLEVVQRLDQELQGGGSTLRFVMVNPRERDLLLQAAGATRIDGVLSKPVIASDLINLLNSRHTLIKAPALPTPAQLEMQFFAGVRVLLAEDNPINQQVAAEFLKRRGVAVTIAEDGESAVALASHEKFDLVLMDLQMPGIDGLEASRQILALPECAKLPIVAMTAAVLPEDREHCTAAGMVDFVAKPIDPTALTLVLQRWAPAGQLSAVVSAPALATAQDAPPELAGFDLTAALRRFDGNCQLLMHVLQEFAETHADALQRLEALFAAEHWEQAVFQLHALKGVAANVGATQLVEAAIRLETQLKIEPAMPGENLLSAFTSALSATLAGIQSLSQAPSGTPASAVDPAALLNLLGELVPYLQARELVPDVLAMELRQCAKTHYVSEKKLTKLMRQIDAFDHDGALVSIEQLTAAYKLD